MGCPMVKDVEAEEVLREDRKQKSNCAVEETFVETQEHMDWPMTACLSEHS